MTFVITMELQELEQNVITPDNFDVVITDQSELIGENHKILLQRKSDQHLMYVDEAIVMKQFNLIPHSKEITENNNEVIRTSWNNSQILTLINLYKNHQELFNSSSVRKDKVWQIIASSLKSHSAEQCKNKFKYLKAKYIEKKDNTGPRRTGEKAIHFAYFKEFDEIFGNKPNIEPVAVASSSRGSKNLHDRDSNYETDSCDEVEQPKKRKKSALEKQLMLHEETTKQREAAQNKRHEDTMKRQDRALELFETVAIAFSKLVEKY